MSSPSRLARDGGPTRILVTGAGGFVGRHLTEALRRRCPDWIFDAPEGTTDRPHAIDVTDSAATDEWVKRAQPDIVVHLAAVAAVTAAVRDPRLAWEVNLGGTLNLVLAMQRFAPSAHLLFISSAEVYGQSLAASAPVDESALLQPLNPYAASKAAADILVRQATADGLSSTIMRPFNHTGPGQSEAFVAPSFAGQIARIEAGLQEPVIRVGNLDDERDFLDVGDVASAYALALDRREELAPASIFNVASGEALRVGEVLERLLSMTPARIQIQIDPDRLRSSRIPRVVGDASRLHKLGWRPTIGLDDTLAAVLQDRRQALMDAQRG